MPSEKVSKSRPKRGSSDRTIPLVIVLVALAAITWAALISYGYDPATQAHILSTAASFATIIAIITGGVWTYRTFIRQRLAQPRLNVAQEIEIVRLQGGGSLLKVTATLSNIGQVQITLTAWKLRAERILPVTPRIKEFLTQRTAFTEREAPWTTVAGREDGDFTGRAFAKTLEPAEIDRSIANLLIPPGIDLVRVYSHFKVDDPHHPLGWPTETLVDLRSAPIFHAKEIDMPATKIVHNSDQGDSSDRERATKQEEYEAPHEDGDNQHDSSQGTEGESTEEE